ncbi:unnamed protein product [Orchesella dallaii]|uniref:Uncharacterized protein n=1 Tax=Orchesella dallaii TaxID=48710 RepID=A0ABP1PRB4_9HEXA
MDRRLSKDEYFQAARVACDNAFPRSARRLNLDSTENLEEKQDKSRTEMDKPLTRSMSRLSPALAAAMLSLPWPPPPAVPENSRTEISGSALEIEENLRQSKSSKSRRILHKKKPKRSCIIADRDNEDDRSYEYTPFHIPRFHEVHTNWPGFDHEPVPNWQEKYAIAKPFPRKLGDVSLHVLSQSSSTTLNNNLTPLKPTKKSRSKNEKGTKFDMDESRHYKSKSKPRQRVNIERLGGSCIK